MTKINTSKSYGVYRIVSPNESCYIGMTTKSFDERWNAHRSNFRNGKMTCIGLQRSFEKYGIEKMLFEVLEDMSGCGNDEILYKEQEWWLRHKAWGINLYNGEPTGRGSVRHTKETRKKISDSMKIKELHEIRTCVVCLKDFEIRKKVSALACSKSCGVILTVQTKDLKRSGKILDKEDIERMIDFYNQGMSLRAISREMGIGHKRIATQLRKLNIEIKKRSGLYAKYWDK